MSSKIYPYLLAIITLIFWGAAPIFGKIGLTKVSPTNNTCYGFSC